MWHRIGWHLTAENDIIACVILGILRWHRNNRSCKEPTAQCFRRQWAKNNTNTKAYKHQFLLCIIKPVYLLPSHTSWRATWFQAAFKAQNTCVPVKGEQGFQQLSLKGPVCPSPCTWLWNLSRNQVSCTSRELLPWTRLKAPQSSKTRRRKPKKFYSRQSQSNFIVHDSSEFLFYILASLKVKITSLLVCQTVFADCIIALNLLRSCPPPVTHGTHCSKLQNNSIDIFHIYPKLLSLSSYVLVMRQGIKGIEIHLFCKVLCYVYYNNQISAYLFPIVLLPSPPSTVCFLPLYDPFFERKSWR